MADLVEPSARAVWTERLQRRLDLADAETRKLSHELLAVLAHFGEYAELEEEDWQRALDRVLAGLGERAGIGPLPPD